MQVGKSTQGRVTDVDVSVDAVVLVAVCEVVGVNVRVDDEVQSLPLNDLTSIGLYPVDPLDLTWISVPNTGSIAWKG